MAEIWAELQQNEWWLWLTEMGSSDIGLSGMGWAAIAAVVAALLVLVWLAGWQQKRRRTQIMLAAVQDASFGRCVPRSRTGAWGFAVSVEPAPERFREFNISYQPVSILNPTSFLQVIVGAKRNTLQIAGVLLDAPTAELIWVRGQPPGRALGVKPGRSPWVQGRLDYVGVEYATRGTNVAAMKHNFQDMMARFAPILRSITIQRELRPHLRLVAEGNIDARDVSPLITAVRGLGRAAMME